MAPHEEILELCAVSIAGELTSEERARLDGHLENCAACREALEQLRLSAKMIAPGAGQGREESAVSVERAEIAFFTRFDEEGGFRKATEAPQVSTVVRSGPVAPTVREWGQLWMPFVAMMLFGLALGISSYRIGMKKGFEVSGVTREDATQAKLEAQHRDAERERQQVRAQVEERDRTVAQLRREIQDLSAAAHRKEGVANGHEKAEAATLKELQERLSCEEQKRSEAVARANELETKVGDLTKQLQGSELTLAQEKRQLEEQNQSLNKQEVLLTQSNETIERQQELLAHDRDVRDLMGARDLYVVDVYDVAGTGETNKPYGRMFYTKGKSLIFYAYDLDRASGLRNASTFQLWGQKGSSQANVMNLGIFYIDSASKKRWVLKANDGKDLAEIKSIFVTVEPDANSHSPRGKQILFAYLRVAPNHP